MNNQKPSTGVPPEVAILLYCGQNYSNPEASVGLQPLLQNAVSWPYLLEVAEAHGMIPILYRAIAVSPDSVPKAFFHQLRATAQGNMLWALRLTKELFKLLDAFESRQIPALAYKGPVLAMSAYGEVAFRGFRDLDIIVQKSNMFRSHDLLVEQGYQAASGPVEEISLREDGFQQSKSSWQFANPKTGISVDLQWKATFFSRLHSPVDRDGFWETQEHQTLAGRTVRVIPGEALLQMLCLHGCRHLWERLIWICDIAALIRTQPGLNWTQLLAEAKSQGSQRIVLIGVLLANRLLQAQVPQDVLSAAQSDRTVCRLTEEVSHRLQSEPLRPIGAVESYSFHLQMLERLGDRMRFSQYLIGSLVAPKRQDRSAVALPERFSFLYPVIRPLRLLSKYGLLLLRLPAKMFLGR